MSFFLSRSRKLAAGLAALALVAGGLTISDAAFADSAPTYPANPATPTTASANALPAPQINGVVWKQVVIGNTVYVGGRFTTARPAGAAPGTRTVPRYGMLAYDITTGVLNTTFAPVINGDVNALAVAPDGKHLYVGGSFTKIGSISRSRVAEIDATTGAVVTGFAATANNTVKSIAVRGANLYLGGSFTAVNGSARTGLAQVVAATGKLNAWHSTLKGGIVLAIVVSADGSHVVLGGTFTSVNGLTSPGYGFAAVSGGSGKSYTTWKANSVIRDAGPHAGVTSLTASGTSIIGTAYTFGIKGAFEGTFRTDWNGNLIWADDCRGDTYDSFVQNQVVYIAGHTHDCASLNSFPETVPATRHRAMAVSLAATQKILAAPSSSSSPFAGLPAPTVLDWFPDLAPGTVTGMTQAAWSITGTSQYLSYGGEFPTVNGIAQQGIVRFALPTAPGALNTIGPVSNGAGFLPRLAPDASGIVRVTWSANTDPDNATLKYSVYRNGNMTTPVFTMTADSTFWSRRTLEFTDTGLTPGAKYTYRVRATDPWGNTALGDSVAVTIPTTGTGPTPVPTATVSPIYGTTPATR